MTKNPSPKVILITGCSSGFGLHSAVYLAQKGHQVIATMRNMEKQGLLQEEAKEKNCTLDIVQMDVTDNESIKSAMKHAAEKHAHIDVLVNNAGFGVGGFFEDLSESEIRSNMETNFFGVQAVTREAIPLMRNCKGAKIINISSVSGFSASPCFGAYNASKWALEGFSESLRYELMEFDIDVLLIQPGTYKTEIFYDNARYAKNFYDPQSPYYERSKYLKNRVDQYVDDCHKDLIEIPELIEKLISAKHPRFRSIPDIESRLMYTMRRILPFRLYSFILRKALYKDFTPVK